MHKEPADIDIHMAPIKLLKLGELRIDDALKAVKESGDMKFEFEAGFLDTVCTQHN